MTRAVSTAGAGTATSSISGLLRFQEGFYSPDELFRAEVGVECSLQQKPVNGSDQDESPGLRFLCVRALLGGEPLGEAGTKGGEHRGQVTAQLGVVRGCDQCLVEQDHPRVVGLQVKAEEKGQQPLSEVRRLQRLPEGTLKEAARALACGGATQSLDAAHVVVDEAGADSGALGDSASCHYLPAAVNDELLRGGNQLLEVLSDT